VSCQYCLYQFCHSCISKSGSSSRPVNACKVCYLERLGVIDRSQLLPLTTSELKYFAKRHQIQTSINVRHEELVGLILTWQAKDLAQRTKLALRVALGGSREEVDLGDLNRLLEEEEPYVSTYSMGGARMPGTILEEQEMPDDWQYVVTDSAGGRRRRNTEGGNGGGRRGGAPESEGGVAGGGRRGSLNGLPAMDVRYPISKEDSKANNPVSVDTLTKPITLTSTYAVYTWYM